MIRITQLHQVKTRSLTLMMQSKYTTVKSICTVGEIISTNVFILGTHWCGPASTYAHHWHTLSGFGQQLMSKVQWHIAVWIVLEQHLTAIWVYSYCADLGNIAERRLELNISVVVLVMGQECHITLHVEVDWLHISILIIIWLTTSFRMEVDSLLPLEWETSLSLKRWICEGSKVKVKILSDEIFGFVLGIVSLIIGLSMLLPFSTNDGAKLKLKYARDLHRKQNNEARLHTHQPCLKIIAKNGMLFVLVERDRI